MLVYHFVHQIVPLWYTNMAAKKLRPNVELSNIKIYINIKGLLTECEVYTGKYLPEVFVQTEQTKLIRYLLYGFWFISFWSLQHFRVQHYRVQHYFILLAFLCRFLFTPIRLSFIIFLTTALKKTSSNVQA